MKQEEIGFFTKLIIVVLSVFYKGFIFTIVWNWFIPVFFGAPIITIPAATGLNILAMFLCPGNKDSERSALEQVGSLIVNSLVCLLVAFIAKSFL